MHVPFLSLSLSPSFPGPIIISECSSNWSIVRRMGTEVILAAYGLLHVCTHSTDEDQPMVSQKPRII